MHSHHILKIRQFGRCTYVHVPTSLALELNWDRNTALAFRRVGAKLILERVPIENLARLGAPEPSEVAGG